MKKILFKNIVAALCFSTITLSSCSESVMDGINDYNGNPTAVPSQNLISDLIVNTAFSSVGGDFSTYASIYVEHEGGTYNQLYNAELRTGEPTSTTTYNNMWRTTFSNIAQAKKIITQTTTGSEKNSKVQEGIARIFLAYNGALATDLFGNVPFTESGVVDDKGVPVYMKPKYDQQENIYENIFTELDKAIVLLKTKEVGAIGLSKSNDYIYQGNADSWIKFAYALKARYTMRLLSKASNKEVALNNVISYIDSAFVSSSEAPSFNKYDGTSQTNPLAALTYARASMGASASFANKLKERKDPRYTQMYITSYSSSASKRYQLISDTTKYIFVPNGQSGKNGVQQDQEYYSCNITDIASKAPTLLISYHELLFLKAEAYARLGQLSNAETALKSAISVSFDNLANSITGAVEAQDISGYPKNYDLSSTASTNYYNNSVKALFTANPLKEIMVQKYLGMNGANGESIEVYNDIRRMMALGENFVTLENPLNAQNKFPYRYVYGSSDATTNDDVKAIVGDGTYVYTSKVWWAGGSF